MSKNEFICDCNVIHQDVVDNVSKNLPEFNTFLKLADFFKLLEIQQEQKSYFH